MFALKESHKFSFLYFLVIPLFLIALTLFCYYPSLHYSFQFDDIANIKKYFFVRETGFWNFFLANSRWISFWLNTINFRIGRFDPFSYRSFNVAFHIISGILSFSLVYSLFSNLKKSSFFKENALYLAFAVSALFLLHPVQTQTISYVIQGQLEGLATLFCLALCLVFFRFTQTKYIVLKIAYLILLFMLAVLSCGTKEIAVVSPFLLIIIDWFFVAQGSWESFKKRIPFHLAYLTLIFGIYMHYLRPSFFSKTVTLNNIARNNIGNILNENYLQPIMPLHYFISEFKVMLHYIWIFFYPFNISVEYDWKMVDSFFSPDCLIPFFILLTILYVTFLLFKKNLASPLVFAIAWFFIGILPRASIIPSSELMSDYKTYLSSMGIFIIIAAGIIKLWRMYIQQPQASSLIKQPFMTCIIVGFLAMLLGFATYNRNKVWHSSIEFWKNIIQNAPGKARAYNNYGVHMAEEDRYKEALPYFKKAIKMDDFYPDPHNNIALCYSAIGQIDLAIKHLKHSIKINPRSPEQYNNLASLLIQKEDYEAAKEALKIAIHLRPFYGKAYFNLGKIYYRKGDLEKSLEYFKKGCMEGDFDDEAGFAVFGLVSMKAQKYDEAIFAYQKVLSLNPHNQEALLNLGSALYFKKNYPQAIELYKRYLSSNPNDASAIANLAESYFAIQDYAQALDLFKKIQAFRPDVRLYLRIANCLELMGNKQEAISLLENLKHQGVPLEVFQRIEKDIHRIKNS